MGRRKISDHEEKERKKHFWKNYDGTVLETKEVELYNEQII